MCTVTAQGEASHALPGGQNTWYCTRPGHGFCSWTGLILGPVVFSAQRFGGRDEIQVRTGAFMVGRPSIRQASSTDSSTKGAFPDFHKFGADSFIKRASFEAGSESDAPAGWQPRQTSSGNLAGSTVVTGAEAEVVCMFKMSMRAASLGLIFSAALSAAAAAAAEEEAADPDDAPATDAAAPAAEARAATCCRRSCCSAVNSSTATAAIRSDRKASERACALMDTASARGEAKRKT
mmetsp:Transcript_4015/g.14995  ORF Transcript_4015/g.14995 Transcript_4015/m.14995 type:complete len:236 (+) Transcript_4015:795-1502(+)